MFRRSTKKYPQKKEEKEIEDKQDVIK